MSNIKLTVDTLDNFTNSAVINIGKNNGYIEAFIDSAVENATVQLLVYNKAGDVVHEYSVTLANLRAKEGSGWTTPKFEPTLD
jgi:uncharacterized protein YheU (UPF0270 family)